LDGLETNVSLFGQTLVDDGRCNPNGQLCVFTSDLRRASFPRPPTLDFTPTVHPGNTTFVDYTSSNIPEPEIWSLMLFSLFGFIHRKKATMQHENIYSTAR